MFPTFLRALRHGFLAGLFALLFTVVIRADDTSAKKPPVDKAPVVDATNAATVSTNAAPVKPKPGLTITTDADDDDNSSTDDKGHKHGTTITIGGNDHAINPGSLMEALLVPLAGIAATFGTPILIVFFVCYFKYKRRRENLALAREYLNKGLTVPPQLLDESQREVLSGPAPTTQATGCGASDLRKGFKWTFIGLGVSLALFIDSPHSTTWGWGLIPMVIGIGLLISGALQTRLERKDTLPPTTPPIEPPR